MSEGEFKKRSQTQEEITTKQCNYSCRTAPPYKGFPKPNKNERFVSTKILVEAKQEILAKLSVVEHEEGDLGEHYRSLYAVRQVIEKWFGDAKTP